MRACGRLEARDELAASQHVLKGNRGPILRNTKKRSNSMKTTSHNDKLIIVDDRVGDSPRLTGKGLVHVGYWKERDADVYVQFQDSVIVSETATTLTVLETFERGLDDDPVNPADYIPGVIKAVHLGFDDEKGLDLFEVTYLK